MLILRYDLVVAPTGEAEDGLFVSAPHGTRPRDGKVPQDDEAISVAGHKPGVLADEGRGMDLGFVPPQDVLRVSGLCHVQDMLCSVAERRMSF